MKRKIYLPLFAAVLALAGCATEPISVNPADGSEASTRALTNPYGAADPVVSGPDKVEVNATNVQLNAPVIAGATFAGWTYIDHGSTYPSSQGTANPTLVFTKFTQPGVCTVAAQYRMQDGTIYKIPKTVTVCPPAPQVYSDIYWYAGGQSVTFYTRLPYTWDTWSVNSKYDEYEWWVNGERVYGTTADRLTTTMRRDPHEPTRMNVHCRIKTNGVWSDNSNYFYLPRTGVITD